MRAVKTFVLGLCLIFSLSGASWLFVSGGPAPFTPATLTAKEYWFRGDVKVGSAPVTSWTQLSTDVGHNGNDLALTGKGVTVNTAAINGQDSLQFPLNSAVKATVTNTTPIASENTAFTVAFVHKGPTLSTGTYYSIFSLAGASSADSATLFYTNLTGAPVFYWQIGSTPTTVVSIPDFTISAWHSIIAIYNGAGSFANAANWKIYLNGVSKTVSISTLTGGSAQNNAIGDAAGGGAPNGGEDAEIYFQSSAIAGTDLTGAISYFSTRYGL